MGFAPTWLRQGVSPPASHDHFNHCCRLLSANNCGVIKCRERIHRLKISLNQRNSGLRAARSAPARRHPVPRSDPAQAFSGMSAHRSAPAHPIFLPLRFPLHSRSAHMLCGKYLEKILKYRLRRQDFDRGGGGESKKWTATGHALPSRTMSSKWFELRGILTVFRVENLLSADLNHLECRLVTVEKVLPKCKCGGM